MCFVTSAIAADYFYFKGQRIPGKSEEWVWVGKGRYRRPFHKAKSAADATRIMEENRYKYKGPYRKLPWGVNVIGKQTSDPKTRAPHTTITVYRDKKRDEKACVTTIIPTNEIMGVCEIGGN